MFLTDSEILERVGMITPMMDHSSKRHPLTGERVPSYGLSSVGYDLSARAQDFRVILPDGVRGRVDEETGELFIENYGPRAFTFDGAKSLIPSFGWLPAFSTVAAPALETFDMPRDVFGIGALKSTAMRLGIHCEFSPLEPGWKGTPSIVLTNPGRFPIRLWDGGYVQILFARVDGKMLKSYDQRDSASYQGPLAQLAMVDGSLGSR